MCGCASRGVSGVEIKEAEPFCRVGVLFEVVGVMPSLGKLDTQVCQNLSDRKGKGLLKSLTGETLTEILKQNEILVLVLQKPSFVERLLLLLWLPTLFERYF